MEYYVWRITQLFLNYKIGLKQWNSLYELLLYYEYKFQPNKQIQREDGFLIILLIIRTHMYNFYQLRQSVLSYTRSGNSALL